LTDISNGFVTRLAIKSSVREKLGLPMARITKNDAEQEIIREWRALPEIDRRTDWHAAYFAMKIKDKYQFRYGRNDRFQAVRQMIIRYQNLIGAPLN